MAEVTLETILEGLKKTNGRLDRSDTKGDERFELIKQELQAIHTDMREGFNAVQKDVNLIVEEMPAASRLDRSKSILR